MVAIENLLLAAGTAVQWATPGDADPRATPSTCRTKLWDVPAADPANPMTAGWPVLDITARTKIYDGAGLGRTYAHHPIIQAYGDTAILIHSSSEMDEDAMGQEVWSSISHDGGFTWSDPEPIIGPAVLANQTDLHDFSYWCARHIPQRAWGPAAIVQSPESKVVYAVADSTNWFCGAEFSNTLGAGRIAQAINITTGKADGEPCWLYTNRYTDDYLRYNETAFGGVDFCDEIDVLNHILGQPTEVPAWSAVLYNNKFYAADGKHDIQEPTHAVHDGSTGGYQRFWRDISPLGNTQAVWTECTQNASQWYPNDIPLDGNTVSDDPHPIYKTDIPDQKTKQYFGSAKTANNPTLRYLISNPRRNTENNRFPLTIAWQDIAQSDAEWTFKHVGVLATNPDKDIAKDTRDFKNWGFSYPHAVQVGDNLIVAYSENKQNIWVSVVPVSQMAK